jgi:Fic family protein
METRTLDRLVAERKDKFKGGLYHLAQIKSAYNSNKIEDSQLSEEETSFMFETKLYGNFFKNAIPVDDIVEVRNHFHAFNYMLDIAKKPLTKKIIKKFHEILKTSTSDIDKGFLIGDWKNVRNQVGGRITTLPENVDSEIETLLNTYSKISEIDLEHIAYFHIRFEHIHPFVDGNGRVGRLILLKEMLKNGITPAIIHEENRQDYYAGLRNEGDVSKIKKVLEIAQNQFNRWEDYFDGNADTLEL